MKLKDIITVSIVEDDPVIRQHLAIVLNATANISCISSYSDAETAMVNLQKDMPDVVLLDIGLPGKSGIDLLKNIVDQLPATDFIMLTVSEDADNVFNSICWGATGYLLKETSPDKILRAIDDVRLGGSPMSSGIARKVVTSFRQHPKQEVILTDRETEILQLLCEGKSYATISDELFVSGNTIRAHIKNIYKKLQVHSRAEVVKKAIKDRLI